MKTQEILSIIALSLLGLCLLCGLAKMAMKKDSAKKNCDKACSMAVFAAVVLLAISQLIGETDGYAVASEVLTGVACEIMPSDNGYCHTPDGLCVKTKGCCVVGQQNCQPGQPICCPNAAECGGISNQCGTDPKCPSAGTNLKDWWNNNCAPPSPTSSQ
jgi:hypothetical protein